jgi:membrane protein
MKSFLIHLRKAVTLALAHDVINTAKAVAYSGMLMLFPAALVLTTLVAQVPEGTNIAGGFRATFYQLLPADTMDLLQQYVLSRHIHSAQVILSASSLGIFAGLGMMLSLMEGFRRANHLPRDTWGFWQRRFRALLLVPLALLPLSLATIVVVFGHQIEDWMILNANHELRFIVLVFWRIVRWSIALLTSVTVLTALYHFGTSHKESWKRVAPGAITATFLWFPATLAFGFYVTRIADYSMFYGSFGAGIATLVWLYLTAFNVLIGAELNGAMYLSRLAKSDASGQSDLLPPRQ